MPNQGPKGGGLARIDLQTGAVLEHVDYPADSSTGIYGEGVAHVNGRFYVMSYKEERILEFNDQLAPVNQDIAKPSVAGGTNQGWGATSSPAGGELVFSDGSNKLAFF